MKNSILTILILFGLPMCLLGQNVEKLNTLNGGNFTSSASFNDTLYTISMDGIVYTSGDDGENWNKDTRFNLGWKPAFEVTKSAFVQTDEIRNQLYVGGSFGLMIYKNGTVTIPSSAPQFFGSNGKFGDIIVTDSVLYASYRYSVYSPGDIVVSNDDGDTWEVHGNTEKHFSTLAAAPNGKVYGVVGDDLYLSDNTVSNFEDLDVSLTYLTVITDVLVLSSGQVIITTFGDGVLTSSDEGATWTTLLDEDSYSITELDNGTLIAAGVDAQIFISDDTGANWSTSDLGLESFGFYRQGVKHILELPDGTLIGSMLWGSIYNEAYDYSSPGILSSTDGGQNWEAKNKGLEAHNIIQMFYDRTDDKQYFYSKGAGVFAWDSGSESWNAVGNEGTPDLTGFSSFPTAEPGWSIAGDNVSLGKNVSTGELWMISTTFSMYLDSETNDWMVVEHDPYDFLRPKSVQFKSNGAAYVHESLGPFQGIYSTTDGAAWTRLENSPAGSNITKFDYLDGYMFTLDTYAFDEGLGMHVSTDEGDTFEYLDEDREGYFSIPDFYVDPVNKELATIVSMGGNISVETRVLSSGTVTSHAFSADETINTPKATKVIQLPNKAILLQVSHVDVSDYKQKFFGYYFKLDSESSWTLLSSNKLPNSAADEMVVASTNEVLMKYGGEIYKAKLGDSITISNEPENGSAPASFTLYNNYPNPFNPTTQIKFELNKASKTTVTVYSVLGQEVSKMELGNLSTGLHQATFNATGLPSGIYLYTIKAGNAMLSGKMTLLK